jgi:hypothetical protein
MPLTAKGKKLKKKFREQYGDKKGDSIFYAMENSGKLKKVIKARGGKDASQADFGGGSKSGGNGRDPSKQYTTKTNLSPQQRETLQKQQKIARGKISPSTTALGKTITYGSALAFGVPTGLTKRAIDYSPLAFGVPGLTKSKTKNKTTKDGNGGQRFQKAVTPIEATKPVDTSLVNETDNFFKFRAYKVGGLSGGVSYGPPPKRGPNSQVPPVKLKKGGKR